MADWVCTTTDEEIDAALERAKNEPELPRALSVEYNDALDVIVLRIDDGRRIVIPREEMQGLENAIPSQLSEIEIHGGLDIAWPQLDVDHYLPYLLEGKYATERWKKERKRHKVTA